MTKQIYMKTMNWKILKSFPLKSGTGHGCLLITPIKLVLDILATAIRQEIKTNSKGSQIIPVS